MPHHSANHAARVRENYMADQRSTYYGKKAMGQVEMYEKTPKYLVAPKYSKLTGTFSDPSTSREMMLRLGSGEIGATLAIPYFPQTPRISDPDAQGVIMIVESIQRGLNRMGCDLRTDGFLGVQTTHCLKQVSGVSWHEKSWLQIIGDVLGGIDKGYRIQTKPAQAMGHYYAATGEEAPSLQWKNVNGVCVASNSYTLNLFRQLQGNLNRVAGARGLPLISVDGKIGNATVASANRILDPSVLEPSFFDKLFGSKTGCDAIAARAEDLIPALARFGDQLKAAPVTTRATAPKLKVAQMPSARGSSSNWGTWLLVAAAAGGGYWYLTKKKPKSKPKKRKG